MIWYKTKKEDDPYYELWSCKEWLYPIENAGKMTFPLIITVEPTNACQCECLYCSRLLMKRKIGFMSLDTMEAIAQEAGKHGAAIRHGGFGEPLLHKKIRDIIAICKKHNVLTTIFSNCKLLTEDTMRSFVDSGLDEIRFSSSGITPEVHNKIRMKSDYYEDFDKKLRMAYEIREKMHAKKPFLTLYTNVIDYGDETFKANVESYKDKYLQFVDKIDIDLTMFSRVKDLDHVKPLYCKQTINERYKKCVTLFLKPIVHWNGDFFACDVPYDFEESYYLGNLSGGKFSIEEGYSSDKMNFLRRNMSFSFNHANFNLCKVCFSNTTKWDKK